MVLKKFLSFCFLIILASCGAGNQSLVDDFFDVNGENEAKTGTLNYSTKEFREAVANDGSIENTITIKLVGRTFTGAIGEEYVGSKLNLTNIPAGLTISAQFVNNKEILVSVTGSASSHANIDDVNNITFNFDDSAFNKADDIAGKQSLVAVNYRDPYALSFDKTIINESGSNDGRFVESINVSVNDLEFSGNSGENFVANGKVTITNAPPGTVGTATKVGQNIVAISLSGTSASHSSADDISNLTVIFNSPAFPTGVNAGVVANTTKNDFGVNFYDPAVLSFLPLNETFSESVANVGAIDNQITIHVTEDTFSGSLSENYVNTGKVSVGNIPPGLAVTVIKATANDVIVSLTGTAANHANANSISNLTLNFSATAFSFNTNISNVSGAQKNDYSVDFLDPYTLSFSTKNFLESGVNDGSLSTTSTITILGTDFTGALSEDFVATSKVNVANIPNGLTASVIKTSANTATLSFSGTALNHESVNNLSNVTVNFLDTAFVSGAALGVSGSNNSDISVQFRDPVSLTYSGSTFFESTSNDGTISNFIDITLSNDLLTGINGENFISGGKATILPSPVASGLTAELERISNTQLRLKLNGSAVSSNVDISGITLTFDQSAFVTSSSITNINGAIKNNFVVDYIDVLTYTANVVNERALNDGQIVETVAISLTGTDFTGTNGDNFVVDGKALITNLPAGLSANIIKNSSQSATLSFSGTANNHTSADDLANISISFQSNAFASANSSAVTNSTISNFEIRYLDPVTVAYSSSVFVEAVANDGSISNTITLTLTGDTFTGSISEDFLSGSKATLTPAVPTGLTASLVRTSSTTLNFTLSGNASVHDIDQGPFTLTLDSTAFTVNTNTTNITNAIKNDISINYNDSITYSNLAFVERAQNDGLIQTTSVITLTGTTFTGVNLDDFIADSKVTVTNLPLGHTVTVVRNSATQLLMSITGTATNHTSSESVSNLTLSFANSAFVGNSSASVANSSVNNMTVTYLDPVALAYSTDMFLENSVNDGSISNSIDIDLSNDTYTGSNGDDFIGSKVLVTNIPVGLTAQATRISSSKVRFSLVGNASSSNIDVTNIGITFDQSAFTSTTDTTNVLNAIRSDIKINYYDLLTYSTRTFTERALNDGQVTQTASVSITGTAFSGSNSDDFVAQGKALVSNVPSGLTAALTRNSSSQLTLTLSGTASSHESADSVGNLTISFLDSALSGSTASTLENATVNDITVNFFDSVAISYSAGVFTESLSNDGSIGNTITLTAINDSFTGSNGENFLANGKATIINLPSGLTATLIKQSASVLQFQLTGNAIDHGDIHDVSNVSLEVKASGLTITTDTTNVLNSTKPDIQIDYISPSVLLYDTLTFTESSANDGSLANTVVVDISGSDTFTGLIGSDLLADGKVVVSNIPTGYSATVIKTATKQVRFTLTGSALSHESSDNVSNIGIAFNATALTFNNNISLVTNNSQSAIAVNFQDAASLTYTSTIFSENIANVGGVDTVIDIDLANDTFTGINGENLLGTAKAVISNVPAGLTPSLTRISSTKVRLQFTGIATNNAFSDSVSNLTLNFQPSAFTFNTDTSTIANSQRNNLVVNFLDPYQLTYSASTFSEIVSNTGELSGSSSISLSGTTFAGNNGDNFISNGMVTVQNLPAGLTAVVTKTATNQVVFTLTGNATNNAIINNIANLGLSFQSAAFTSGNAAGVLDSVKSDFIINFIDPYSLTLSGTTVNENIQNVGTITETLLIDLVGHTFSGTNSDDFVVAGKVIMGNVPSGLTARVIRNSATQLELSYSGTAASHINSNDISNISFVLQNSALTGGALASNVINYSISNFAIDFLPPYTLSSNGSSFDEDGANNGSVSDTITYTLVGTTFAGLNGRDLFSDGHVSLANTPAGLTPVVTKIDDNNVSLSFSGNALSHAVLNNSANTNVNFLAGAFTSNNENGITPNNYTGLSFSWDDPPALSYSPTILLESNSNIGATTTSVSIFAANKTFNGSLAENFVTASKVTVTGHPSGLVPVVTYASPNQVNLTFTGNATNHADADDIATGISVSFNDTAFVGGNSAQVVNGTFTSIGMDFIDPYQLNYAASIFNESSLNNGSIANSISITVSGTLFTGSVSEEYVGASKAIVRNIPAGLTATVTKLSTSLVEVILSGNAAAHEAADNISNLEVEFLDTAFASGAAAGVNDSIKSDISVAYNDTASVLYSGSTLAESATNIGNIGNTITISVDKDTFTGPNGENFISTAKIAASNVPVGLVPQVIKTSATTLDFTLTGSAVAHENVHDISNVTLSFAGSAFSFNSNPAAINNSTKSDFAVDYIDAYQLTYVSSTFNEAASNDGSIGNTLTVNLVGTTFTGTNGDNFVAGSKVTVSNLPSGLTAVVTRSSTTSLTLSLTGNATSHANSNDLSSVGIIFADSAFTSGRSAGVLGYSKSDIAVNFDDPPFLTYLTGIFNEAVSNIGAVSSTVDITLTNTTFSGSDLDIYSNGTQISFSNVPSGLTAQAQKIDSTTVRVSLLGNALSHGSTDSIASMGIQFNDSAFNSVLAANITNNSKSDYSVNFINPYSISYSGNTFTETATNIGAIATSVDITVVGTTFTGANNSVYVNGTDATFLNTPSGLTPRLEKINNTTVRLTFTGNASSHAVTNNTTSFGISLQDSIFTSGAAAGVSNNTKIDFNINYLDPYTITYSLPGFQEAASNNGQIGTTVDIDISGTTFSGVNGANYTLSNQYTLNNLPSGLTAVVFKVNSTKLRLFFTGSATLHEDVNDISNFTVALTNNAFTTGAAAGVLNNSKSDFIIDFIDGATLAYSGAVLNESIANTGAIDNTIVITLANDTFSGLNGENYVSNSKVVVSNIPAGLLASVTKISDTTVGLTLTGNANNHLNVDDISNLTVTFNASAFSFNSDATTITNYSKNDIAVNFDDQYTLGYAPGVFSEAALNDGSIGNSIVITATGTNFTTTGSDFISEGKVSVTNVPSGLSASIVRDSATQLTLSLSGNATNNLNSNDISNLTVTFANTAFTTGAAAGVDDAVKGDLQIDFDDQPAIIFASNTFNESSANVGATLDSVNINLTGATFSGTNGDTYLSGTQYSVSNVPAGLVASVQKITATQLRLTFTGSATSHAVTDNISNLGLTLTDSAFNVITASNVTNNSKSDFVVTFRDPYTLTYSSNVFVESNSNIGAISTSININVTGTTFTGANGANYTNGVEYSFANLPLGLGVQVQKVSSTQLALTLTGSATSNDFADSIVNFTTNLLDGAFSSGAAAGVNDTTKSDFNINFIDPYTIAYSGSTFSESGANDGSISNFIDLTLTGTSFTGSNGANYVLNNQYTVANVPSGLTVVVNKLNSTTLRVSISGQASSNDDSDGIANLTIALQDTAFISGAAAGVIPSTKTDYIVDFSDNATLAYSSIIFNEAVSNIGAISNTLTVTLANDTFTGTNGDNYISSSKATVTNLPAGLIASVNRTSNTTVDIVLTGQATANLNANDISSLSVVFSASAFNFNTDASTVTNSSRSDLSIDFIDQYSIAYLPTTFLESAANDGSVDTTVTATLTGSTFTTTGSDFISESKVSLSNVPSGLVAVATRVSATQIDFTFTSNASNHANSNDISNLTITFADSAFTTGAAAGVDNSVVSNLLVDFNNPPSLAYASSIFSESDANTGAVSTTINVNLTDATFSGVDGAFYSAANQFNVSNVPLGLTLAVQKISSTQVQLSLSGSATSHAVTNNIANLGIQFTNNAFNVVAASNVTNNSKSDFSVNYRDPYTLGYSGSSFSESVSNIGAITSTVNITVAGTTFTGADSSIYTNGVEYSYSNLPTGLGVQVQKINSTQLQLSFTGSATAHASTDSIINFTTNLLDAAFTSGAAAGVNNTTKADFALSFIDPYSIAYSAAGFNEAGLNDGSITETIDLDITGTTFTGANSLIYTATTQYTVANVPAGLTVQLQKINGTKLRMSLTGTASAHASANNVSALTVNLLDSAFTSGSAAGVVGSSKSDLIVAFVDNANIAYSASIFNEAVSNIGAISNTLTLTLSNDTYTGVNGENFVSSSKVSVTNVPAGLTAAVTRTSDTTVDVTLSGNASSNTNSDDISSLSIVFSANAFSFNTDASTVTNYSKTDVAVNFLDQYSIAYSGTVFTEGSANNGSLGNSLTLTLTGSTFTTTGSDFISEGKVAVTNIPTGLVADVSRVDANNLILSFTGNATNNLNSNDISNLTVTFADSAFTTGAAGGVDNATKSDLQVDFNDQPLIAYSASTFTEAVSNVGTIGGSVDIDITNATFSGANSSYYALSNQFTVSNVPAGLTLVLQKITNTKLQITFTGGASSHAVINNISNLGLQLTNNAFNLVASSDVTNNSKSDFAINYRDPYTLAYSGSVFNESVANVGTITDTVNITVTGTTFTGADSSIYTNGVEYSFSNLPAGLGVQVQKVSATQLQLSFTSSATSHANTNSIGNFTLNLLGASFTSADAAGVENTTKANFALNFIDPYSIAYSANGFNEAGANNGSITETVDLDITGTTYTGTNGVAYVALTQYTVANVPGGLTAVVTKINGTKLRLSLSGTAAAHASVNNIADLTVTLLDAAFTSGSASGVIGSSKSDFTVSYADNASIAYSSTVFNEAVSNVGAVSSVLTLTLSDDTFAGINGENYVSTGKASVSGLPAGLLGAITRTSATTVDVSISGDALFHANANDLSTVGVTFASSAFDFNTDATTVANYSKSDLDLDFIDPYVIAYSSGTFNEAAANNGSIDNSVVITISGGANFTTTGSDFITESKVSVTNVPSGLVATVVRDSATQLTLSLTGSASNHANSNDISSLSVVFADTAFDTGRALGVTGSTKTNFVVDFNDAPSLAYSASNLTEEAANTGSIAGQIDITLTNDTFTGSNGDVYTGAKVSVTGVPAGLASRVEKISDTVVRLTYTSSASAHTIVNNVGNINLSFQNAAFTNVAATNIINSSKTDLAITFRDPYTLAYSGSSFNESLTNTGAISSTIDITLTGTTFTGANSSVYVDSTQYTTANEPAGLTPVVTKINDTTLRISFTGSATSHDNTDDIANFTISLLDGAFTSGASAGVLNTTKSDFVIDFLAPATLAYSSLTFNESNLNNGTVTDTITIDIANDTFTGAVNSDAILNGDIVVTNLPNNFVAVAQKINSTRIVISLTGAAINHANAHDVSNLDFEFAATAFTNNTVATNVANYKQSSIAINYEDPYILSYSTTSLVESGANNGAVNGTITINLVGTTFTGSNSDNFAGTKATITNHPTGLTPVLTKNNNNQLTLSFTGTATAHADAEDVSNITVVFDNSAFASGAAAGVDNSSVTNISIDFNDLASIAYSSGTFTEAGTNIGAIGNTITLTLSDDTFTGTNGDNFAGNGNATVNNVPAGLTATLVRASATTLTLSLNGNASIHLNANDISNVEVILAASAFTFNTNASLITNATKSNIAVDFDDPYAITYSALVLAEAAANDGSISATLTLDLVGTTFTGTNLDNFVGGKALVANVPSGLTAVLTRNSATQLQLSFTGSATANELTNSIANLSVTLNDSAFTSGAAAGVTDSVKSGLAINFNDKPVLTYQATALDEDLANTGTISGALIIDLTDETFATGTFDGTKVSVTNIPPGMGSTVTRNSATQVQVNLTGTATTHTTTEDISNMTVTFLDAAFVNVAAANIVNSSVSTLEVNFRDSYSLAFSSGAFIENVSNDGAIVTSITATVSGTGFNTPTVSLITDGMVSINNVPSGLTASAIRNSGTQITISFTGTADDHASTNSISNLEVIFNDTAFFSGESDGVSGSSKLDFDINYNDPASLAYSTATFTENLANDGTISNFIDITLSADTFTGSVSDDFAGAKANITAVPSGLTASLIRQSSTVVRLILSGPADDHESLNDVSTLGVEFLASAFTNNTVAANVANYIRADLVIDYIDAYQLTYSVASLNEDIANDGSISATIGIALTGTTFVAGTDFISESKVTATNHPGTLTPVLTRVNATNLTLSFTGAATLHELVNSVSTFNLTFLDTAFVTGNAAGVINYDKADIALNFKNQAVISYSTDTFSEASGNDGSIGNSINISISDDTFTGANGSDFITDGKVTILNVPALYTATLTKISGSTLTLALSGAVLNGDHEDADDISNIQVTFLNTAVVSNRADLVANRIKSDVKIDYSDVILPAISAVTPPANAYYTLGQNLSFTVAYSEDVDVVGTPRIVFDIDGVTVYANYTGGDGTSTLIFEYTTIAAQQDLDGITISSSTLDLNGGSIKKAGDAINNALVSFSVPNTSSIFVDTITPNTISGLTLDAPGNTAIGSESPDISWVNPITATDNIDHIEIALGTAAGANNIIDYTDIGNVQTFQFTGVTPDFTQCSAGAPKYYPVVRVHDDANNISSTISNTAGFLYDNIDPLAPAITSVTFDADNTRSATLEWTAGSDACGIASYEMSIGEDLNASGTLEIGEIGNIQAWTDVGNVLTSNLTGLTLLDNVNYHTAIRTVDITGRKSTYVVSSRWRANFNYRRDVTIAPTTTVTDSHVKITLNTGNFTYANAGDDLEDLRFFTVGDVALSYWIEYHDAADETRIWVKIPDTGTSTIVMKYGTENLSDGQDKTSTFSFATAQDLYVEMSTNNTAQSMNVASYINGNSVTVSTASTPNYTINEGDVQGYASVEQALISANGGISGRVLNFNSAYEAIIPLSEAATEFGFSTSRNNTDKYTYYNPNSTSATVTTKAYTAAGAEVGTTATTVVAAHSFATLADADSSNNGIVLINTSTLPVVGYYSGNTNGDGNVQPQATTELFGVPSSTGYVSCTQNSTTFTVYRSSNSIRAQDSYTCNDGERVNISDSNYSQGLAPAIRIVSNNPIFGTSTADSDGLESASFMGLDSLDRDYIIPTNSEYAVMACPYGGTNIEVFDETGVSVYSNTCNANGLFPGKDKLLATQFSLSRMPPGYRIKGNKPFFMMYEYENQDETSIYGGKSARKYLETPLVPTVSGTEY